MKRMRYIHVVVLTVLGALAAACTSDERDLAESFAQQTPMRISISQGNMSVGRTTRGYTSTTAYDGAYTFGGTEKVKIGLARTAEAELWKTYTASNTGALSISPETDQYYWRSQSDAVTLRAWSYGTADEPAAIIADGTYAGCLSFTIPTDQSGTDDKELLYAPAADYNYAANATSGINLDFYHQMSRVVINVKRDNTSDAYTNIAATSIPAVTIGDGSTTTIPQTGYLTLPTGEDASHMIGTWSGQTTETAAIRPKHWETPTASYEHTYSAVLIPGDYNGKLITVPTAQGSFYYTPTSTLTLQPGKQYTFNIELRNQQLIVTSSITNWGATVSDTKQGNIPIDIRRNPLWYVAEYNMTNPHTTTWLTMGTDITQGYFYIHPDAMQLFSTGNANGESTYYNGYKHIANAPEGTTWHLPIQAELWSIVPGHNEANPYHNIFQFVSSENTTVLKEYNVAEKPVWGYNDATKAGISEVSYFVYENDGLIYAVRFLGTPYCSIWKYAKSGGFTNSDYGRITITSKMLSEIVTKDNVATKYGTAVACAAEFDGLTFDHGDDIANAASQRVYYMHGLRYGSSGTVANQLWGNNGPHWSATHVDASHTWNLHLGDGYANVYNASETNTAGMNVRMFRDSYTAASPSRAVTTVENIMAGVGADFAVGDVVCQDGSIFRYNSTYGTAAAQASAEGRNPIGVIVYKCAASPTETDYKVTEGMGHALVMGIDDISTGDTWAGSTSATGMMDESYGNPDLFPNLTGGVEPDDYKGLVKTNVLANHLCDAGHSHPAFEKIKTWREQSYNQVQFNATDWFVPSISQWIQSLKAIVASQGHTYTFANGWSGDAQNALDLETVICTKAGGIFGIDSKQYHTCSENTYYDPYYYAMKITISSAAGNGIHYGNYEKTRSTLKLRPFFAF